MSETAKIEETVPVQPEEIEWKGDIWQPVATEPALLPFPARGETGGARQTTSKVNRLLVTNREGAEAELFECTEPNCTFVGENIQQVIIGHRSVKHAELLAKANKPRNKQASSPAERGLEEVGELTLNEIVALAAEAQNGKGRIQARLEREVDLKLQYRQERDEARKELNEIKNVFNKLGAKLGN